MHLAVMLVEETADDHVQPNRDEGHAERGEKRSATAAGTGFPEDREAAPQDAERDQVEIRAGEPEPGVWPAAPQQLLTRPERSLKPRVFIHSAEYVLIAEVTYMYLAEG
jgi:hypothetical protein